MKKEQSGMYQNALLPVVKIRFGMDKYVFVIQKLSELTHHVSYASLIQALTKTKNNVSAIMVLFSTAFCHLVSLLLAHKMPYPNQMRKGTHVLVKQDFTQLEMFVRSFHNVQLTLLLTLLLKNAYAQLQVNSSLTTLVSHVEQINNLIKQLRNVSANQTSLSVQELVLPVQSSQL